MVKSLKTTVTALVCSAVMCSIVLSQKTLHPQTQMPKDVNISFATMSGGWDAPKPGRNKICLRTGKISNCKGMMPSKNNIFFLETTCANQTRPNKTQRLSDRQACAIYSAARYNPTRKVIFLITCSIPEHWTVQWGNLFDLPNFFYARVDVADLYSNNSLSDFYHRLNLSKNAVENHADILRLYILYLYGGTYLDLDIISFKSLDDLGYNFVVEEGLYQYRLLGLTRVVVNGVLNFEPRHDFLRKCILEAVKVYDPKVWNSIGPTLITAQLKRYCNIRNIPVPGVILKGCNIKVHPRNTFFSVMYKSWRLFYDALAWNHVENMTRLSHGAHYWNHMGYYLLQVGSSQPLIKFAEQHCPPIYHKAGRMFSRSLQSQ